MVATATAMTIEAARIRAGALADKVVVPNVRYRRDIGSNLIERDFRSVENLNLFD